MLIINDKKARSCFAKNNSWYTSINIFDDHFSIFVEQENGN